MSAQNANIDPATVDAFGREWTSFDNAQLDSAEREVIFSSYFRIFSWQDVPADAVGFDFGCGSGRWALCVAPRVARLCCIDASPRALDVARRSLSGYPNCTFLHASNARLDFRDDSMDFGYALGVLHHVPDASVTLREFARILKPGAPLLLYMYYALENRPAWFRAFWRVSNIVRMAVSRIRYPLRRLMCDAIAAGVYLPLARATRILEKLGIRVDQIPLAIYRNRSFYVMRNDALDRFGTPLEKRFTAQQIERLLEDAGFKEIRFSPYPPYWCVVARAG